MPKIFQLLGLFCLGFVSIGGELREVSLFVFNNQREGREGREGEKRGKAHNNKSKRERRRRERRRKGRRQEEGGEKLKKLQKKIISHWQSPKKKRLSEWGDRLYNHI